LRGRILDASNNLISGATVTINRFLRPDSAGLNFIFPAIINLPPGTYRAVVDSNGGGDASNYHALRNALFWNSAGVSGNFRLTTSTDGTTWTDSTTADVPVWLIVDNIQESKRFISDLYK